MHPRRQRLQAIARGIGAEQVHIGRLALGRILAGGLAELRGLAFDVQQVVADLEGQSELVGETIEQHARGRVRFRGQRAQPYGRTDERTGLERVQVLERDDIVGPALHVERLPRAHARGAAGARELANLGDARVRRQVRAREHLEGQGLQGIAGENGGGLVEGDVHGGLAAA